MSLSISVCIWVCGDRVGVLYVLQWIYGYSIVHIYV